MRALRSGVVGAAVLVLATVLLASPVRAPTYVARVKTTGLVGSVDPFTEPALATYLKARVNLVTAAVYDVTDKTTYLYNPGVHEVTASMVKIDILAVLLHEAELAHRSLTQGERAKATSMVEESDNKAATTLWNDVGQLPAMSTFHSLIGFHQTEMSWSWGDIETTPLDELALLKVIALPNVVLSNGSRAYMEYLMQHVDPFERFGLGAGSPAAATVGLKDGYYPEKTGGWQINTAGYVRLGDRFYLATIMTTDNPSEAYGISTVTDVSKMIWEYLRP